MIDESIVKPPQGDFSISKLRPRIRGSNGNAGGSMGHPHRGIRSVAVLAAGTRSLVGGDLDLLLELIEAWCLLGVLVAHHRPLSPHYRSTRSRLFENQGHVAKIEHVGGELLQGV